MTVPPEDRASAGRVALGFLAAAFASVTAFLVLVAVMAGEGTSVESVLGVGAFGLLFGIPIAGMAILFLALPAYLLMRTRWRVQWWNAALAGFLVGIVPGVVLGAGLSAEGFGIGLAGLVGGLAFWAVVRKRPAHIAVDPETFR